jgi:hypothetical protein
VDGIHDHASGLAAAALIGSTYRNLHNLFDKHMPFLRAHSKVQYRGVNPSRNNAATLENTTLKHIDIG